MQHHQIQHCLFLSCTSSNIISVFGLDVGLLGEGIKVGFAVGSCLVALTPIWSFVSDLEKILHSLFAEIFSDMKQSQNIQIRSFLQSKCGACSNYRYDLNILYLALYFLLLILLSIFLYIFFFFIQHMQHVHVRRPTTILASSF